MGFNLSFVGGGDEGSVTEGLALRSDLELGFREFGVGQYDEAPAFRNGGEPD